IGHRLGGRGFVRVSRVERRLGGASRWGGSSPYGKRRRFPTISQAGTNQARSYSRRERHQPERNRHWERFALLLANAATNVRTAHGRRRVVRGQRVELDGS